MGVSKSIEQRRRKGLLQGRPLLGKGLLPVYAELLLTCAVLGVVAANLSPASAHPQSSRKELVEVCDTVECTLAAAEITQAMDTAADPCEDFYQFACGGWIANNPVPDDVSGWNQFNVLRRRVADTAGIILSEPTDDTDPKPVNKAKVFYSGCMDEDLLETQGLTPLTEFMSQFGGWPMTLDGWDEVSFDWQVSVAEARRQVGADYLVSVGVSADLKDTFSTAIYIDQTSLGLPRSILTQPDNYGERIAAYKTYMSTTASIIANSLGQDASQIDAQVDDVLAFEMTLAATTSPVEDRRDIDRMYNPMTVAELGDLTADPSVNWLQMLSSMFASTSITIDANTRVIVQEMQYLHNLTSLVAATSPRTLSNYIMWRHVNALGDDTTKAMRDATFHYDMVASGVTAPEPRSKVCADNTNGYLGIALGTKYVDTYFSEQAKDEVNAMVEDLRLAFKNLLDVNEWMDEETKPKATEKADAMNKNVAFPDWYGNDTALESYYGGLGEIDNSAHFANVLTLRLWESTDELQEFGKPAVRNKDPWSAGPVIVNAWYTPEYNSITFPAGILQPPFYRPNTLMALNYGAIGQLIGHEITHGFDDEGRQYDKDGNAIPWWTNDTLEAFKDRAECIVDQYDNIRLPELDELLPNATINGVNTQGENIADNGGMREALLAYNKYVDLNGEEPSLPGLTEYSGMQLFFLSSAKMWCTSITLEGLLNQVLTDPHSPGEFRVLMPLRNMKEFSTIWDCPAGSGMNPDHKCVVW